MNIRGMPQARDDYRSGQICAVLANIHRAKDAKVFEAADFIASGETPMPDDDEGDEEDESIELIDIEANSRALERMLSGKKD